MQYRSCIVLGVVLILTMLAASVEALPPGIQNQKAPLVSPGMARQLMANRVLPRSVVGGGSETEITPEIQELARGLRNDPQLIFEYVRNSIEYVPIYGSIRSATQTMLDGKGNDFDQTSLLIALTLLVGSQVDITAATL